MEDNRNTDNAWFETVATNFHDESGALFQRLKPVAEDPALEYQWDTIRADLAIRPNHKEFIKEVIQCSLLSLFDTVNIDSQV